MSVQADNRRLVRRLIIGCVLMFGFGFALVPLYDVFCEVTGFGGRTNTVAVSSEENPDYSRSVVPSPLDPWERISVLAHCDGGRSDQSSPEGYDSACERTTSRHVTRL